MSAKKNSLPKKDKVKKTSSTLSSTKVSEREIEKDNKEEILPENEAKLVSKKKIIYVEIDDEVTAIYDKIKSIRTKDIYIVVPKRAIIFQSIVNLKILKRKAEDDGKTIYLISNDSNGVYLAQQIGIQVYDKNSGSGGPGIFSAETGDEKLRITPLKASVNSIDEELPTRLKERKLSIGEILSTKNTGKNKPLDVTKLENKKKASEQKKKPKFVIVAPNRHALIGLVSFSLVILLIIVYIALPGVTIYLTPSAGVLEKSVNITLADYGKNRSELETHPPHVIASYPIETTISKSITHFGTGKRFSERGANSSGNIMIFNTTKDPWPLVDQTRFQTNDGIVFRISGAITVPPSSNEGPGSFKAFVTADPADANGVIVGERGNIEPSKFFLPGLKEDSRSKIYGESYEPMTGGVTDFISFITEEDIEAAKSRINDELLKDAIDELKREVVERGDLVGDSETFTLLEGKDAIKIGDVQISVPGGLVGQELSEFVVEGTVQVSGIYYDHEAMLEILKSELSLKKSPQKELLGINEDSTSYRIFEWNEATGKIKITANIKGIEQFSIDPDKESGVRLLTKIQEHIAGKDIEEAKVFIQNLPEINKVEIESWPAWSPTIPNITDNIKFEVRKASTVE